MFSLGVVLAELFYPFQTAMERAKILSDVRLGKIPSSLATTWPQQVSCNFQERFVRHSLDLLAE